MRSKGFELHPYLTRVYDGKAVKKIITKARSIGKSMEVLQPSPSQSSPQEPLPCEEESGCEPEEGGTSYGKGDS